MQNDFNPDFLTDFYSPYIFTVSPVPASKIVSFIQSSKTLIFILLGPLGFFFKENY